MKSNFFKYLIPRKDIDFMSNTIQTEYDTQDYKIKLIRNNKVYNYSTYKYICTIEIYNKVGLKIDTVSTNEIEIIKALDNLFYGIDNNTEVYCYLNNISNTGNYNSIKLDITYDPLFGDYVYILNILKFNIPLSLLTTIASINFYGLSDIYNFLDLMYMTFLVNNIDISNYNIEDNLISDEFTSLQLDDL